MRRTSGHTFQSWVRELRIEESIMLFQIHMDCALLIHALQGGADSQIRSLPFTVFLSEHRSHNLVSVSTSPSGISISPFDSLLYYTSLDPQHGRCSTTFISCGLALLRYIFFLVTLLSLKPLFISDTYFCIRPLNDLR